VEVRELCLCLHLPIFLITVVEINTKGGINAIFYTHSRHYPEGPILRTGSTQRNNRLGRVNSELQDNFPL
jgi:hypothetical protein